MAMQLNAAVVELVFKRKYLIDIFILIKLVV